MTPPTKRITATAHHKKLHQEITQLMQRVAPTDVTQEEVLCIAAQIVGQAIALQDSRYPQEYYTKLVMANIEAGNRHAVEEVINMKTMGRA